MNVNCEIVQDLLPLYEDGVCSESSRAAIEEHLQTCETCRALKEDVPLIPEPEIVLDAAEEEKKVVGSFKKVRRWWGLSLIAIVLLVPLLVVSVNQFRGVGISFANLDDIWTAKRFLAHLQNGEYEEAAAMHDFKAMYQDIQSALEMSPDNYRRQYEKIVIDGEAWYMDVNMADQFRDSTDALDIWMRLFCNYEYYGIMFPEEALEMIMETEPELLEKLSEDCYRSFSGGYIEKIGTPWGEYFTEANFTDGDSLAIMPEAMYLEYLPTMKLNAENSYNWTQNTYAAVAEMTEEEFCEHMRERYASELKEGLDGVTITGGSYSNVLRAGDEDWQVGLNVRAASGAQANDVEIVLFTKQGMVRVVGISYSWSIEYSWLRNLSEALNAGYLD